jgi:hypothetical protein
MKTNAFITSKDNFPTWQAKTQKLFREAKETELSLINRRYKDVLADHKSLQAASERIIDEFSVLCGKHPKRSYSWKCDKEILGAHVVAMAEMARNNGEFLKKMGNPV